VCYRSQARSPWSCYVCSDGALWLGICAWVYAEGY
jgi:hypothetical protein